MALSVIEERGNGYIEIIKIIIFHHFGEQDKLTVKIRVVSRRPQHVCIANRLVVRTVSVYIRQVLIAEQLRLDHPGGLMTTEYDELGNRKYTHVNRRLFPKSKTRD